MALRTKTDPASITPNVLEAIHSLDPDLPLAKIATLTTLVDDSLSQPRFAMLLLASFGVLALLLASIGMYGVISYSVAQRTQEIGIRMALGAEGRSVFGMVLSQGARLTGLGIAIGLVTSSASRTSWRVSCTESNLQTRSHSRQYLSYWWVLRFACYLPARRATRVDPMVALRHE